jgi:hypothetical protein
MKLEEGNAESERLTAPRCHTEVRVAGCQSIESARSWQKTINVSPIRNLFALAVFVHSYHNSHMLGMGLALQRRGYPLRFLGHGIR